MADTVDAAAEESFSKSYSLHLSGEVLLVLSQLILYLPLRGIQLLRSSRMEREQMDVPLTPLTGASSPMRVQVVSVLDLQTSITIALRSIEGPRSRRRPPLLRAAGCM